MDGIEVDGREGRLFDLLRGPHATLLIWYSPDTAELIAGVQSRFGQRLQPAIVIDPQKTHPRDTGPRTVRDPQNNLSLRYGAGPSVIYLIRPDGYVGFRSGTGTALKMVRVQVSSVWLQAESVSQT